MTLRTQMNQLLAWSYRKSTTAYDSVTGGVPTDLLGKNFLINPYPFYDKLRAQKMGRSHLVNGWWQVDFEGVQHMLKTPDLYSANPTEFDRGKRRQESLRKKVD